MKKFTAVLVVIVLVLTCLLAVACNATVMVYLHNYDGYRTIIARYDGTPLPTPSRSGYVFGGWYKDAACTQPFLDGTEMTSSFHLYAKWTPTGSGNTDGGGHVHDFGDNYFMFVKCSGCDVYGRNEGENTFLDEFVYDFDASVQAAIDETYDELVGAINSHNLSNDEFIDLFEEFDAWLTYLQGQLYISSTWSDVYYDDEGLYSDYVTVSNYFYKTLENYYKLFGLIDKSDYASSFWSFTGWSQADIQAAIAMGDSYSSASQAQLDEILSDYYDASEELYWAELYYEYGIYDYEEYVEERDFYLGLINLAFGEFAEVNNSIAESAGYTGSQNYMDYSYANDYNRNYSPAEVQTMRNYVKTYIGGIFENLANTFDYLWEQDLNTDADVDFWNSLEYYPMLMVSLEEYYKMWSDYYDSVAEARSDWEYEYDEAASRMSTEFVGNYFSWLNSNTAGAKEINFLDAANNVFKNGNYFLGSGDGAYTAWIPYLEKPIMFFGYGYQTAFTFIHEFGHYYENVYNGSLYLSYDHDETQSQGNEMLFLAWLAQNKGSVSDGYDLVQAYQLADILCTIIMSTAVDEFEQVVYSGATSYNGKPLPTMASDPDIVDYSALYTAILETYVSAEIVESWMSADYWQVAFDSPCYYISYAMSALVSVEIYVEAMTDGLDAARNTYFKLFTFGDQAKFVGEEVYDDGSIYRYLKEGVTYEKILGEWCGLKTAFDETLYKDLQNYFRK